MSGKALRIRGIVQGVGFRPMVWRLARQLGLCGAVWNDSEGVTVHIYGHETDMAAFIHNLPLQLPPLARLDSLDVQTLNQPPSHQDFRIIESQHGLAKTAITADAATCPACLGDIADPANRRYRYPFTNCTHCGPRLSIIRRVPYDRCHTSMAEFKQCAACQHEYDDPADRRFHAQANCCPDCGPQIWLEDDQGQTQAGDALALATLLLKQGFIVAIKGLGGFHLACDASHAEAVQRLRERKRRYAKPFALMAKNAAMVARYAKLSPIEHQALHDKSAPIVLLTMQGEALAPSVAPDGGKLGFMLPYTPLHTLLMDGLDAPIVLTSGNISDEPQCTDNNEAREKLAGIADYCLLHDRAIVNRLDDSVVQVMDGHLRVLRRARGYSPEALVLPEGFSQSVTVLAMGAELKNSFCLLKDGLAIVSQHIGDLENAAVQQDYRNAIDLYQNLYDFRADRIAVDQHPGYLSTQYGTALKLRADSSLSLRDDCSDAGGRATHGAVAERVGVRGISLNQTATSETVLIPIQHHHAHLAACLAEHAVAVDATPVLAAIFDGLGLGDDGGLWGGEFLLGDYKSCTRLGHFQPIALPGGTQAMREPWRNTYAHLQHYFAFEALQQEYGDLDIMQLLANKPLATLATMISKNLNSPLCTSCGRWFDAFAAALGLHSDHVDYEGQAAIALEILASPVFADEQAYPDAWHLDEANTMSVLSWQGLWKAVLADLKRGTDKARIAARIHHSLAEASGALLLRLSEQTGVERIVLSGGVFQNRLLLEAVTQALQAHGKTVLSPQRYPMNDGGLALGQAVIAAVHLNGKSEKLGE